MKSMIPNYRRQKPLKRLKLTDTPWIKAIPQSPSHGSGILQKKLWRLTSDYVRIRDWYKYGVCTATGKRINHWTEGHAGHFKSYAKCNGMAKFDERNIWLQSPSSNGWGDYEDWKKFEYMIKYRDINGYDEFVEYNKMLHGTQITSIMVVDKMKDLLDKMANLPEQPDYYEKTMAKMSE